MGSVSRLRPSRHVPALTGSLPPSLPHPQGECLLLVTRLPASALPCPGCRGCGKEASTAHSPSLGVCPHVLCPSLPLMGAGVVADSEEPGPGPLSCCRQRAAPRGAIKPKGPPTSGELKCF